MPTKGTPVRTVRIPDDVWAAAVAKAERQGTSVSAVLQKMLSRWAKRP